MLPIYIRDQIGYTWQQAVKDSLRLRPDRIIVGEVRDGVFDALPDADARWQTVYNALEARNLVDDATRRELTATADRASNILENVYWLARDENQDLPDLAEKIRRQLDEAEASIAELRRLLHDSD